MRRLALGLGPLLAATIWLIGPPVGVAPAAWRVLGAALWMATWWLTAVVPLEATALLPLVLFPLLKVGTLDEVAAHYADPVIFLFLGGFLLAAALERWDLHLRLARAVLDRVGTDARRTVLAMLLVAGVASMWVSNTATAVMLLPIANAIARRGSGRLGGALVLAVAYGASIGGVATLIGTPPNALLAANARELIHRDVTFAGWLPIGLACTVPLMLAAWWVLVRVFRVEGALEPDRSATPGPWSGGQRVVLAIFVITAAAWILRAPKMIGSVRVPGLTDILPGLSDAGIAMGAGVLLMVLPLRNQRHATPLDWATASGIPWGILLIFGGGLALAGAFESSGLSGWIGSGLSSLRGVPLPIVLVLTTATFVALTELTSNTATAALAMPLVVGTAQTLGLPPWPLMAAAALACSMAFMLPVATPPNAIAFGSGQITTGEMAAAGWRLNLLSIAVITVIALLLT